MRPVIPIPLCRFGQWLLFPVLLALVPALARAEIRGAALLSRPHAGVITWGTQLQLWPLRGGAPVTLLKGVNFGPGGCVADVDGDGRDGLLVQETPQPGRFVWLRAPHWESRVIESQTQFRDCLAFEFDGRRGVVLAHFDAQVRFYEFPKRIDDPWPYIELYSIYTASRQGGLLAGDVDGDGLTDLFIGNYWMRNPGRWDLPWRLFNMNTFFDHPDSALARQALFPRPDRNKPDLIWAESEGAPARLAWLERPADVRQQWPAHLIEPAPNHPRALLVLEPRPGAWPDLLVGADDGLRLYRYDGRAWTMSRLWTGAPVLALFRAGRDTILAVTPKGIQRIRLASYRRK
ncbi:MAG: hypothetical protein ACLQBJ_07290 [Bryobacteraceae bacterium]